MFKFTRNQLIAAYAIVGIALAGMGMIIFKPKSQVTGPIRIVEPGQPAEVSTSAEPVTADTPPPVPLVFVVHVAGKVNKPGLYELKPGSRITDALESAGGSLPNADLESINLAEKVEDGQQIYVAAKGQIKPPAVSVVRGGTSSNTKAKTSSIKGDTDKGKSEPEKLTAPGQGTVNINSAGLEELQRLPGIGPSYAQRIIDYRTQNGRFQSVDELDEVKGIGPKKLEKLRPFVTI